MNLKNKKTVIITVISLASLLGVCSFMTNKDDVEKLSEYNTVESIQQENVIKEIESLKSISGVKAEQLELINNPVGVKGSFVVPKKSILSGLDYFLKNTKNDKMDNVKLDIGKGYISIKVDYKVTNKIVTPIEVKVIPTLSAANDLELNIQDVKFLDLKVSDWLVNLVLKSFIKDWFPKDGDINIEFNEGSVIINKDNFKGLSINSLKVESSGLNIGMTIDLSTILNNLSNK